jgi:hypothetical protein
MARATEINVWNARGSILFHVTVAERTTQFGCVSVTQVIKHNRLIDRGPGKNRENAVKEFFCFHLKSVEGNDPDEENANDDCETCEFSSHNLN